MAISFYISSSKIDIPRFKGLEKYLKSIDHNSPVLIRSKKDIYVGENENQKIYQYIRDASIIVSIISVDYIDDCKNEIFKIFDDKKIVIPILFRDCNLEGSSFEGLKILSYPDWKDKNPDEGFDSFWNYVSDHVRLRYKNELKIKEQLDEEKIISAYAGHSTGQEVKLLHLNLDEVDINQKINLINSEELKIRVIGDSMVPDFHNNDIITCKFVDTSIKIVKNNTKELTPEIKEGKFHVIETRDQGIMIKYVQYIDNRVFLISKNPLFRPISLTPDEIISIWEVKSLHRAM